MNSIQERLRSSGVTGEFRRFDAPIPTAQSAAMELNCPVGAIANSLVFEADDQPVLILASGAHRVNLEVVARVLLVERLRRARPEFVMRVTGQVIGGVGPIGHPEPLLTLIDGALALYDPVWAGAGDEHSMFATSVDELARLTSGRIVDVV